jgi:hypothetical protein
MTWIQGMIEVVFIGGPTVIIAVSVMQPRISRLKI